MTKMTRRESLVLLSGTLLSGCNSKFFSPTAPSITPESGLIRVDTPEGEIGWSPYLVVQPDATVLEGYKKALMEMKARGNVRGVRIPLNSFRDPVVEMVSSLGLEMIGIISNEELLGPNPKAVIDHYVATFPDMRVLQIGNEVSTLPNTKKVTVEQYMDAFKKIYDHVQSRYPSLILMTQSTFGSGYQGSNELKRMVDLGLNPNNFSNQKIIVGINVYTEVAFNEYVSTRNEFLSGYRFWVMESGTLNPAEHISKVRNFYPRLATALSAERIYWYALWATDDDPEHAGYSLIKHPRFQNQMTYSPLGQALVGVQGGIVK